MPQTIGNDERTAPLYYHETAQERRMEKSGENYSLLLLAGGRSSRMGTDKGELFYRGRTFIENLLRKAIWELKKNTCPGMGQSKKACR